MEIDQRYAIIIGINNYSIKPLDYAVNDAISIKETLLENCLFEEDNIHMICSDATNPIYDVTGRLLSALAEIQKNFISNESSIVFYFAGHGAYHFTESALAFHDSLFPIGSVFDALTPLNPKFLFIIIDACESGSKVLTRGKTEEKIIKDIEKFLEVSSGTIFMYACQNHEEAHENSTIGHGIFTNQILECLKDQSNYDKDGILVPDQIAIYVRKNTLSESNFKQTPVIEIRSTGYYPFAFSKHAQELFKGLSNGGGTRGMKKEGTSIAEVDLKTAIFPDIEPSIRNSLFDSLKDLSKMQIRDFASNYQDCDNYEVTINDSLGAIPSNISDLVIQRIIETSKKEKIEAAGNLFSVTTEPIKDNFLQLTFIDAFMKSNEKKYRTNYWINQSSDLLVSASLHITSKNIYTPQCGFGYVIYVALYGVGFVSYSYLQDWNGFAHSKLNGPHVDIDAYKCDNDTLQKLHEKMVELNKSFDYLYKAWKRNRVDQIEEFDRRSR